MPQTGAKERNKNCKECGQSTILMTQSIQNCQSGVLIWYDPTKRRPKS